MQTKSFISKSEAETESLGRKIGSQLKGVEVIELISDLGGGKTTLTRGIAQGFGSKDQVASPSFTISYVYSTAKNKQIHHFDFYRLEDAGIVGSELEEVLGDKNSVVIIEWGDIVHNILPKERIVIRIKSTNESTRNFTITCSVNLRYIIESI